jgi:hypothetical protein
MMLTEVSRTSIKHFRPSQTCQPSAKTRSPLSTRGSRPPGDATPLFRRRSRLRSAIRNWHQNRYNITLDPDSEVIVTIDPKEVIAHLCLATVDRGDVVLVPTRATPSTSIPARRRSSTSSAQKTPSSPKSNHAGTFASGCRSDGANRKAGAPSPHVVTLREFNRDLSSAR